MYPSEKCTTVIGLKNPGSILKLPHPKSCFVVQATGDRQYSNSRVNQTMKHTHTPSLHPACSPTFWCAIDKAAGRSHHLSDGFLKVINMEVYVRETLTHTLQTHPAASNGGNLRWTLQSISLFAHFVCTKGQNVKRKVHFWIYQTVCAHSLTLWSDSSLYP